MGTGRNQLHNSAVLTPSAVVIRDRNGDDISLCLDMSNRVPLPVSLTRQRKPSRPIQTGGYLGDLGQHQAGPRGTSVRVQRLAARYFSTSSRI